MLASMVVIFGWGGGNTKDLGEVAPTTCPRCHNDVFLHHVQSDRQFSLYFVPLATYAANDYLLCPICRNGIQVRAEHRQAVTAMSSATRLFRRGGLALPAYQGQVARFWAQLGVDGRGAQVLQSAATIPPAATTATPHVSASPQGSASELGAGPPEAASLADQLAGLARLRDDGVLTDDEFAAAKRRLLETS
jgi:hypothetical protein